MIVTLRNVGSIKEATINLDKDLMIFIGPNNTGKTYASYCLYGLRKLIVEFSDEAIEELIKVDLKKLYEDGVVDINLEEIFSADTIENIVEEYRKEFKKYLPQIFDTEKEFFSNSSVDLTFGSPENFKQYLREFDFSLARMEYSKHTKISFQKLAKSPILRLTLERIEESHEDYKTYLNFKEIAINSIKRAIVTYTFRPYSSSGSAYFIPAERIGISVFSKDLLINRFTKTNEILTLNKSDQDVTGNVMDRELNTYSLIIQDALQNFEDLTRGNGKNRRRSAELNKLADELEQKILKGTITVSQDGNVFYNVSDNHSLKIQSSGSIIKSLVSLVLYLRHYASKNQILIIDEPEINLHPDNQRLVARILAKLSKLGVKVIVSTHSDYFIRELNNLIMLNKDHKATKGLKEKYNYSDDEVVDYKKVATYLFKDQEVKSLKVTETGMEAATIDDEINKLNNTSNDIYWSLFESEL